MMFSEENMVVVEDKGACTEENPELNSLPFNYRLSFTSSVDIKDVELVRIPLQLFASSINLSPSLKNWMKEEPELTRLLKFYTNILNHHSPLISYGEQKRISDDESNKDRKEVIKLAFAGLVNLSAIENVAKQMVSTPNFVEEIKKYWIDSKFTDSEFGSLSILINFCVPNEAVNDLCSKYPELVHEAISVVTSNPNNLTAPQWTNILANMAQSDQAAKILVEEQMLPKFLPFLKEEFPKLRVHVARLLYNCLHYSGAQQWLVDKDSEIISYIFLPLAGGEEFTEEEYDKMPIDLQYLPSDKCRDPNPEFRSLMVRCIQRLSFTQKGWKIMRDANVYFILRELHKFEKSQPQVNTETVDIIEDWVSTVYLADEEPEFLPSLEVTDDLSTAINELKVS